MIHKNIVYAIKIESCKNSGNINAFSSTASTKYWTSAVAGGIVGSTGFCEISQCYNTGNITSKSEAINKITLYHPFCLAGGIAGGSTNTSDDVIDCYNIGKVTSTGNENIHNIYAGGVVGYLDGGRVTTCYSSVMPSSNGTAKLIGSGVTITSCVNNLPLGTSTGNYSGFDFKNVWFIDTKSSYHYPQLKRNPHS